MHMILEFNILLSYMRVALLTERALQGAEIMDAGLGLQRTTLQLVQHVGT